MNAHQGWREVYDFWFPAGLDKADLKTHREMGQWWMRGGANAELPRFRSLVEVAVSGALDDWAATPRGLFAGTPNAYASDPKALRLAEEGLENGHYVALPHPWERLFFTFPLEHAEGPDHLQRLDRVVALAEQRLVEAPPHLRPLYEFGVSQSRSNRETISKFGRYPHRNMMLGRATATAEEAYLEKGDFVYKRPIPDVG